MKIINIPIITQQNLDKYYLSQSVIWRWNGPYLQFFNMLFKRYMMLQPRTLDLGELFVNSLENGRETDIMGLIEKCFSQDPHKIYTTLCQEKIIE